MLKQNKIKLSKLVNNYPENEYRTKFKAVHCERKNGVL